jgi:hypothetical protein
MERGSFWNSYCYDIKHSTNQYYQGFLVRIIVIAAYYLLWYQFHILIARTTYFYGSKFLKNVLVEYQTNTVTEILNISYKFLIEQNVLWFITMSVTVLLLKSMTYLLDVVC